MQTTWLGLFFVQPGLCLNPFKFRPTIWPCDHQVAIMCYNLGPIKLGSGRFFHTTCVEKKKLKHNPHLISSCIYEAIFHTVFPLPYLDYGLHNTKIFYFICLSWRISYIYMMYFDSFLPTSLQTFHFPTPLSKLHILSSSPSLFFSLPFLPSL